MRIPQLSKPAVPNVYLREKDKKEQIIQPTRKATNQVTRVEKHISTITSTTNKEGGKIS